MTTSGQEENFSKEILTLKTWKWEPAALGPSPSP